MLGIDCDLRRRPHAVFAWTAEQAQELDREAAAATRARLDVRRTDDLDLPFPIAGALVREDQAELQIASYIIALTEALVAAGGQVFEGTTVTRGGEGSRPTVRTEGGAKVRARDVVVATHYPTSWPSHASLVGARHDDRPRRRAGRAQGRAPPRLPRRLEPRGALLGLPMPRLALRPRRTRPAGPRRPGAGSASISMTDHPFMPRTAVLDQG
jgi:hypothetical protein